MSIRRIHDEYIYIGSLCDSDFKYATDVPTFSNHMQLRNVPINGAMPIDPVYPSNVFETVQTPLLIGGG